VNVTFPLGDATPGATTDTLAVKVTGWSGPDESGVEVSTVADRLLPTRCVTESDMDGPKLESPE
jgi:hypothetical protein